MSRQNNNQNEIRFICDDNLGKLARYLRVGGFDTIYDAHFSDSDLIRISLDEERYILTRDNKLIERTLVRHYFLIEDDRWINQLKAVVEYFGLQFIKSRMFTRCLEDNTLIESTLKHSIKSLVYPYIYKKYTEFRQCPLCKRVFWPGTHTAVMMNRLRDEGIDIRETPD